MLKRVLLLAALLDRAAGDPGALPRGTPLLFRTDSRIKGSADLVSEFVRPLLAGAQTGGRAAGERVCAEGRRVQAGERLGVSCVPFTPFHPLCAPRRGRRAAQLGAAGIPAQPLPAPAARGQLQR